MSFLPEPYSHEYEIAAEFSKSVAYFSMEFAIDQALKTYSGGLGFLAGSHMRSAAELRQNLVGIGVLWTYGYYNQVRGEDGEMAVQYQKKEYSFLQDTGMMFPVVVHDHPVQVKAYYLPGEVFGTVPMFFLTTDVEENDDLSRQITRRLYARDALRRIAQYIILGAGGARLLDELGVEPDVYHLNEAHGLSAAFHVYRKRRDPDAVKKRFVFTTHTPEAAGNEETDMGLLEDFSFFSKLPMEEVRGITGIDGGMFNHTLAALRLSRKANAVSALHGEVSRKMWEGAERVCPITHVTNAQNKRYWTDKGLESARERGDKELLKNRKRELKQRLFEVVADQTGKLFDPDVLTVVWARRFAGYKRADLITHDVGRFKALLNNRDRQVQVIWAGKPYPTDYAAIDLFNHLVQLTRGEVNATVLVGYDLRLSKLLKDGADVWLNNPIVTREASGTSGMSAAMNGAVNLSTDDGWVCEFAKDRHNCFVVPKAEPGASPEARDRHDREGLYRLIEGEILPRYYERPDEWWDVVMNSMNEVVPFFESGRMAREYYEKVYSE